MQCLLLGTGGTMPMPDRPLTSAAARVNGSVYLFDCGEGTQVPYKALHVGVRPLRVLAVTHLHADHVLGIPGMLMLRAKMDSPDPLVLVGPSGLKRFVTHVVGDLNCFVGSPVEYIELQPAGDSRSTELQEVYRDDNTRLLVHPLNHSIACFGYRLEEFERPGKFDPALASALGLPPGPAYRQLQAGNSVIAPNGQEIRPGQVLGPARRGRHLAFCTDTSPCKGLYRLLDKVDLAIIEGMYLPRHAEEARKKQHLEARDAARISQRAGVLRTVLVHFSPRYGLEELGQIDTLAREVSPAARAGLAGETIEVALPE